MRTPVFRRPEKDIVIIRLATGEAVVRLYVSYMETPASMATGGVLLSANVLDTKVPDSPDLEMDVQHRFSYYYEKALREEVEFLTGQYQNVVYNLISRLPPGKKAAVVEQADRIIQAIAAGDKPFITQQELEKYLKMYI